MSFQQRAGAVARTGGGATAAVVAGAPGITQQRALGGWGSTCAGWQEEAQRADA